MQLHLGRNSWTPAKAAVTPTWDAFEVLRGASHQLTAKGELDPCVGGEDKAWNME